MNGTPNPSGSLECSNGVISYLLDANVFIEAARRYYAFDLVPTFWKVLADLALKRRILSIDRVREELIRGKDDLAQWVSGPFAGAFVSTDDEEVIQSYREIIVWLKAQDQYQASAKKDFAKGADGWLLAYAKCKGPTLVTQEVLDKDIRRKVPIPNICQAFDVSFFDTFSMLRELGVRM